MKNARTKYLPLLLTALLVFFGAAMVFGTVSHAASTTAGQGVIPPAAKNPAVDAPVSFKLDVMPVFMRAGCNVGGCHGAARGKDGFRLSLFGFDPEGDYYRITREQPTRRINLAVPQESLLLLKSTGAVPHTGGKCIEPGSAYYQTILRWLQAGALADPPDVAKPVSLELSPQELVMQQGKTQQLAARAHYSDGSQRDVTNLAVFLTSNENSAAVTPNGLITCGKRGEAFVMARFATFTVGTPVIVIPPNDKWVWPNPPEENFIDQLVDAKLKKMHINPSASCSDEVFVRRIYIDIVGMLPTSTERGKFLADADPKKREKLIDSLLDRKEFVDMWVMKWAELLKIRSQGNQQGESYKAALRYYDWLKDSLQHNVPFDQIVRDLIGSSGGSFDKPQTNYYVFERETLKLAENTAQVFMGIRVQCAQCHNHPFDRWTLDDYYGFADFFADVVRKPGEDPREMIVSDAGNNDVEHPIPGRKVVPKFLGGEIPDTTGKDRRQVLADWIVSPRDPYFVKNLANMIWSQYMGRGIVEPVDDVRISNPPSNAELLDTLGKKLQEYHYDYKHLVRDICNSRAYQSASETNDSNSDDQGNFSHAAIRRVRAEVMLDMICQVTETHEKYRGLPLESRAVQIADGTTTNFFLTTFGRAKRDTVCSCEVSMQPNLSQALTLINGNDVEGKIQAGGVIRRLMNAKQSPKEIISELYSRCLGRMPSSEEMDAIMPLIGTTPQEHAKGLEDLFWSLLNSKEFMFNH
jgi:hypothetical protein